MSAEPPRMIAGQAIVGEDLVLSPVEITVEQGVIAAIEETSRAPDLWICPAFFNAHTHLGDTIAMDCAVSGDLESLVTPPDGLKHRYLRAASPAELAAGMRKSMLLMKSCGTAGCADFREGGTGGVEALKSASAGLRFRTLIFGREGGERIADGLGISSTRDVPDAAAIAAGARKAGRLVACHAGERDSLDVDEALSLSPDLIVHATHATERQLKECADRDIPIAVCPQSNWLLSVTRSPDNPPISRMLELGCRVFLGTDNVMFVQPDMPAAMAFLHTVYHIDPEEILRMAVAGSILTGDPFYLTRGARANLILFNPRRTNLGFSRDPVASIVKRGTSLRPCKNVFNL